MKYCIVFLFYIHALWAQERSFGTLSLVQKAGASRFADERMDDSPKYKKALIVYNKLVTARGDYRFPVPVLVMKKAEEEVACINYEKLEITLEEKAYDVCMEFGVDADAALAFLLSHELTHYYEKHAWRKDFTVEFSDLNVGKQLKGLEDEVADETQADYLGGFLAYSAGYGLFDKGSELISRLYKSYTLPDSIPGYPLLKDRAELIRRSAEKLSQLIDVFEMANLLTAISKYTEAYEYYRYVLIQYQSREIYNNLGVCIVLETLNSFLPGERKYRYPIELDLKSSASKNVDTQEKRQALLRQALLHFDGAISMDPKYAPAYLNKACTYALLNEPARALFYAEEAKTLALAHKFPKTAIDADVLKGILEATKGNTDPATKLFQAAIAAGSDIARFNLNVLQNKEQPAKSPVSISAALQAQKEKIAGLEIEAIADDPKATNTIPLNANVLFHLNGKRSDPSRTFICQNEKERKLYFMHTTGPGYKGKSARKIGIGDDLSLLTKAYGPAQMSYETVQGQILVYKDILFIMAGNKLKSWVNYLEREFP